MKPLIVLLGAFAVALVSAWLFSHSWNFQLAGCIAMSVMLLFTSIAHFAFTKGMAMMIPVFIPFKKALVWFTGVLEIIAAITLLIPSCRYATAIALVVFFILMLPANISAAMRKVDYQAGTYEGNGINYLWFRVPLQIFFIVWVYWFALR